MIRRRRRRLAHAVWRAALLAPLAGGAVRADDRPLETVVVTERARSGFAGEAASIPGGATALDGAALRERSVANLADLLRYVPGVWSASHTGDDRVFFSSRGSNLDATDYDMNGIKLLQDGLPVTSADGNNHNRVLDPLSAEHAIVARGANALEYGASTLGGAIEFMSPTARAGAGREAFASAGSHGQLLARVTTGGTAGARDALDALVTVEGKRRDGYREHASQRRAGLYANAGYRPSDRVETRVYLTLLDNDQELPGSLTAAQAAAAPGAASAEARGGDYRLDVRTARLASRTLWSLGRGGSFELGVSYEQQSLYHPIVDRIMVDIGGEPVEVFSLLIDTRHENANAVARYRRDFGRHELLLGLNRAESSVDGGHYRNLSGRRNGLRARIDNRASSTELYAVDRFRATDRLTLELAAQAVAAERDVRTEDVASGAVTRPRGRYSRVNPRLGFIYELRDGIDLYGNASRLFEPPTNYELEDEASGTGAVLAPMRGTVLELGARGGRERGERTALRWEVSLYRATIDDEILSVDDPFAPGTSLSANVDRTVHAGVEAAFGADVRIGRAGASIAPQLALSVNDFQFSGDPVYGDNELPAAPGYVLRAEVLYRHPRGFYAGPTFDVVDERFADFANTYRVPSYSLIGLRAGWANERWRTFLELRNLRDRSYVGSHGVRNSAAPDAPILNPGEPRSAYLGVQARF